MTRARCGRRSGLQTEAEREPSDTLGDMLAANIWYWWLGVILTGVGVLSVLGLVVGYLKNVTALRYPSRKQEDD